MLLGWVKRVVPFVLAFVLGLFVASFFVSISAPKMRFERKYKRTNCFQMHRVELDRLQSERENLQVERENLNRLRREFRRPELRAVPTNELPYSVPRINSIPVQ